MPAAISGESDLAIRPGSAEGATAPESLRPKDRYRICTLKSHRRSSPGAPKEQAGRLAGESLRSSTEGVSDAHDARGFPFFDFPGT
jgi:hypothetical protein